MLLDLEVLGDNIGYDKIIVIGSLSDEKLFLKIVGSYSELFLCVNDPNLNPINFPLSVFVLKPKGMARLWYVKELFPEYNHKYFNEILPRYFEKHIQ